MLYPYSDRATPGATFGEQTDLTNPSWIDNNRLLAFGGHFRQVNVDSPGGGNDDAVHWFDDAGNEDVGDGELSRQGDRLALIRSYGPGTHLAIYAVAGGPGGAAPDAACFSGTDASLAGPSWAPDGTKLAFADAQGIEVLSLPQVVSGDCPGAGGSTVVPPGGSAPDWGPAPIGPGAGTWTGGPSAGGAGSGQSGGPSSSGVPRGRGVLSVRVPPRLTLAGASHRGIAVRAHASIAGRIMVRVSLGRRVLGTARATTAGPATVTIRVRLRPSAVQALSRWPRARRVTIAVTLLGAEGKRTISRASVVLS